MKHTESGHGKLGMLVRTLGAVALLALTALPASADIIPAGGTPTVTPLGGGLFRWDYLINLSQTQNAQTGDFFTIYDFGPATAVVAPANWLATSDSLAPTPVTISVGNIAPTQTAALNWTFTYTGVTTILGTPMAATPLGTFSLTSTSGTPTPVTFVGRGTDSDTGARNANLTNTSAPTQIPSVPEPASMVLLGTGLLGVVRAVRSRRQA